MDTNWKNRFINGLAEYQNKRSNHWNDIADSLDSWRGWGNFYHKRLAIILQHIIPKKQKVLEIGSGEGKLLDSLAPSFGLGLDFSEKMCLRTKSKYPNLHIIQASDRSGGEFPRVYCMN